MLTSLEKLFNMGRKTITKHIKALVERKFIEIFKVGNMNAYAINAFVVFTQGDANLWKAKFSATMYLDYDEQTAMIKKEYTKQITTKKGR
jgi:predicted transcriptional regulator